MKNKSLMDQSDEEKTHTRPGNLLVKVFFTFYNIRVTKNLSPLQKYTFSLTLQLTQNRCQQHYTWHRPEKSEKSTKISQIQKKIKETLAEFQA